MVLFPGSEKVNSRKDTRGSQGIPRGGDTRAKDQDLREDFFNLLTKTTINFIERMEGPRHRNSSLTWRECIPGLHMILIIRVLAISAEAGSRNDSAWEGRGSTSAGAPRKAGMEHLAGLSTTGPSTWRKRGRSPVEYSA